jgi:hypothetical protein
MEIENIILNFFKLKKYLNFLSNDFKLINYDNKNYIKKEEINIILIEYLCLYIKFSKTYKENGIYCIDISQIILKKYFKFYFSFDSQLLITKIKIKEIIKTNKCE